MENPLYKYPNSGPKKTIKIRKSISTILADIPDPAQLLLITHSLGEIWWNFLIYILRNDLYQPEKNFQFVQMMTDAMYNDPSNPWRSRKITYEITTPMIPTDLSCLR